MICSANLVVRRPSLLQLSGVVLSRTELEESAELAELAEQGFRINTPDLTISGRVVAKLVLSVI